MGEIYQVYVHGITKALEIVDIATTKEAFYKMTIKEFRVRLQCKLPGKLPTWLKLGCY